MPHLIASLYSGYHRLVNLTLHVDPSSALNRIDEQPPAGTDIGQELFAVRLVAEPALGRRLRRDDELRHQLRLDLPRQREIAVGQRLFAVSDQTQRNAIVVDRDVRVMTRGFRQVGHGVDEGECPQERPKLELLAQFQLSRGYASSTSVAGCQVTMEAVPALDNLSV